MPFTNDPVNSPIDRMRLRVGDTDEYDEGLSDETYEYLYEAHNMNEKQASLEALKMLVFKYARYVTEKTGGLFVKESEKYAQYKELLDSVTKDPSWSFLQAGTGFAGGIYTRERLSNRSSNPFSLGEGKRRQSRGLNGRPSMWIGGKGWTDFDT